MHRLFAARNSNGTVDGNITAAGSVTLSSATDGGNVTPCNDVASGFWGSAERFGPGLFVLEHDPGKRIYTDTSGTIQLTGTDPNLDIFNVKGSDLNSANTFIFGAGIHCLGDHYHQCEWDCRPDVELRVYAE